MNLQRVGLVEGDAAGHVLPVLEVAVEADGDVEAGHDGHGGVEDAVPSLRAANRSIGSTTGCTITEKAPTRAFSWLNVESGYYRFHI